MAAQTWVDRLQPYISLTSPETQTVFFALWRGDSSSAEKMLGKFRYPLSVGTVVQDLGLSGFEIPMSIYFEGPTNDKESQAFLAACAEFGPWTVNHPVRGTLTLQLEKVGDHVEPVESGNITVIDLSWINVNNLSLKQSSAELTAAIQAAIGDTNASALTQMSNLSQAIDSVASAYGSVTVGLNAITQTLTSVNGAVLSAYSQIQNGIAALSTDYLSISGLMLNLIETPGLIAGDLMAQLGAFASIGNVMTGVSPSTSNTPGQAGPKTIAQASGAELVMTGVTCAMAVSILNTLPTTRPQAIAAINALLAWWAQIQASLDGAMALFATLPLAQSYVSMATTYPQLEQLFNLMLQYLLSIIFDLNSQITFTLPAERAPIAIAIDFYGQNGWDDSFLDLFIASNHLYGDLINILPAGFQVTIYPQDTHG